MAETARQEKLTATRATEASKHRPASAGPATSSRPGSAMAARKSSRPASAAVRTSTIIHKDPALEALADENFPKDWASLTARDLNRSKPWGSTSLGQHVVAGAQNSRLVGSRYRHMPEPAEATPQYTDFYGPVGGGREQHTYYGGSVRHLPALHREGKGHGKVRCRVAVLAMHKVDADGRVLDAGTSAAVLTHIAVWLLPSCCRPQVRSETRRHHPAGTASCVDGCAVMLSPCCNIHGSELNHDVRYFKFVLQRLIL